jgi:hypothetical protein
MLLVFVIAGCAARLPTYPPMEGLAAAEVMSQRAAQVRTISGPARIQLRDPTGQSVELDAAIAAELPGKVRVRAWKMGHAVMDITIIGAQAWVLPSEGSRAQEIAEGGGREAARGSSGTPCPWRARATG